MAIPYPQHHLNFLTIEPKGKGKGKRKRKRKGSISSILID
jgi:hypothetical protein